MTPALNHDQRKAQAGNARHIPVCGGMGQPAPIVDHDQFQIAGSSSLRQWRGSKARPNCRGVTASALSFTPRSLDLDEISELRTRRLSGAAALILNPLHHQACKLSDAAETIQFETLSSAADCHDQHRDREAVEPCSRFRGIEYPR